MWRAMLIVCSGEEAVMVTNREKSDADETLIRVRPSDAKTCRVDVDGINVFRYAPRGGEGAASADERAPGLTAEGESACAEAEEREAARLYGVFFGGRYAFGDDSCHRDKWLRVARDVLSRRVVVDAPE